MNGFGVLLRKEIVFHIRTYRLLVVGAVFVVTGMGTPLLLHFLPQIIEASGDQMGVVLPTFTPADVVKSYTGSFGQIGLITAVLVSMGLIAGEVAGGTAAMVLSKPVGRGTFVTAKLTAVAVIFLAALVVSALGTYLYTTVLFGNMSAGDFLASNLLIGLYLLDVLALTVMSSAFFKSPMAAGGCALAVTIALTVTTGLPLVGHYVPGRLMTWAQVLPSGQGPAFWGAVAVGAGVVALATMIGWQSLKRKEL
jgi:ABC-2 type transport system permease protein